MVLKRREIILRQRLHLTLPRFMNIFNNPPEAPIPFQYKVAESSCSVYAWDVEFDRDEMEFVDYLR